MNKYIKYTKIALLTIILAEEVRKITKNKLGIKFSVNNKGSSITYY